MTGRHANQAEPVHDWVRSVVNYAESERSDGTHIALTDHEKWLVGLTVDLTLQHGPTTYEYHAVRITDLRIECAELCGGHPEYHISEYRALNVQGG